jgi:hypothetical protein
VYPGAPYSKFQAVSVPPAVQVKSAVVAATLEAVNAVGSTQEGASPTTRLSIWGLELPQTLVPLKPN